MYTFQEFKVLQEKNKQDKKDYDINQGTIHYNERIQQNLTQCLSKWAAKIFISASHILIDWISGADTGFFQGREAEKKILRPYRVKMQNIWTPPHLEFAPIETC